MGEPAQENDVPDVLGRHRVPAGLREDRNRSRGKNLLDLQSGTYKTVS